MGETLFRKSVFNVKPEALRARLCGFLISLFVRVWFQLIRSRWHLVMGVAPWGARTQLQAGSEVWGADRAGIVLEVMNFLT